MDAATRYLTGCSCKAHGECHASRWTAGNKANHTQECAPGIMQSVQQPQQQQQPPQQRRQPCVAWRSEEEMRACSVEVTRRDGYSRTFLQYLQSVETDVTKKKGSARREKTITWGAPRPRGRRAAAGGLAATRPGDLYRGERSRDGQRGFDKCRLIEFTLRFSFTPAGGGGGISLLPAPRGRVPTTKPTPWHLARRNAGRLTRVGRTQQCTLLFER